MSISIEDPKPRPWTGVSPSQIRTYEECERKWFLGSVCGIKTPQNAGAQRGDKIHAELEAYVKTGAQPQDPAAYDAVPFLPPLGPHLQAEGRLEQLFKMKIEGVPLRGRFDLMDKSQMPQLLHVWDHKSTSRPEYAKVHEQIPSDTQVVIYGGWALHRWPDLERVKSTLLYIPTNGEKPFPRTGEEGRREILQRFGELGGVVKQMKASAAAKLWSEVRPNYKACSRYGGCPFQARCATAATIKERLLMKFGKKDVPAVSAPAPAIGAVGIVPPDAPTPTHRKGVRIFELGATYMVPVKDGMQPGTLTALDKGRCEFLVDGKGWACTESQVGDLVDVAPEPAEKTAEPTPAEPPVETKPKRTRKPKADAGVTPVESPASVSSEAPPVGLTLYIDCAALKGAKLGTNLADLIHKHAEAICNKEGVPDLRFLPYATGKGALAAELRKSPPTGEVWCTSGELSDAAIEALVPMADRVIRGTR